MRRSGRSAAFLLVAAASCADPGSVEERRLYEESLWVGVVEGVFLREDTVFSVLVPLARRDGDDWIKAWDEPVSYAPFTVALDSAGQVDAGALMETLPLDLRNPKSPRVAAPGSWLLYLPFSDGESDPPAPVRVQTTAVLRGQMTSMDQIWKLRVGEPGGSAEDAPFFSYHRDTLGVAFNREADEAAPKEAVPGLAEIEADLGFLDADNRWALNGRVAEWLGFFRFGATWLGVAVRWSPDLRFDIVELDGGRSRVVATFRQRGEWGT